ncbi:MAG: hypothetical protein B6I24_04230 [Bacteroidetes bacterium 4572_128]|nr:MAG: hypothetical protein B6I24_04230 [Bacteroidetes bacterium 4572_128]
MKNNYLSVLFIAILLLFSSSCQEEENVFLKEKHLKNEFVNPYDYVGYHHNRVLEFIYNEAVKNGENPNKETVIDNIVNYAVSNLEEYAENGINKETLKANLLIMDTVSMFLHPISTVPYLDRLEYVLLDKYVDTTSFDALHSIITNIEFLVYSDENLSGEEKELVLGTASVIHHSLRFWEENLTKYKLLKNSRKRNWPIWDKICHIAKEDSRGYRLGRDHWLVGSVCNGISYSAERSWNAIDDK